MKYFKIEVSGRDICFAISYNDKKYNLIGNTSTNDSLMKVYKANC